MLTFSLQKKLQLFSVESGMLNAMVFSEFCITQSFWENGMQDFNSNTL